MPIESLTLLNAMAENAPSGFGWIVATAICYIAIPACVIAAGIIFVVGWVKSISW